jgi:hypothetical protein
VVCREKPHSHIDRTAHILVAALDWIKTEKASIWLPHPCWAKKMVVLKSARRHLRYEDVGAGRLILLVHGFTN